jgi:polyisoprenoid-binding protein YceI
MEMFMHVTRFTRIRAAVLAACAALAVGTLGAEQQTTGQAAAQPQARGGAPVPDPTKPQKLEIQSGTKARYRVTEQLAGISFPSDAVGTTETITGALIVNPDGSFAAGSKITVDLRTLTSDQSMRDSYIQTRTLETGKFPMMEVVAKRAIGLAVPLAAGNQAQAGFQLVTDITLHGVTREITWNVVATLRPDGVGGRATTTVDFATFGMTKPSLARLLSVEDKIHLEIEFRCTRLAQ